MKIDISRRELGLLIGALDRAEDWTRESIACLSKATDASDVTERTRERSVLSRYIKLGAKLERQREALS